MYTLPIRLKEIRVNSNLTQSQIAEKLGMTYQEYQKIENGKTIIRADKLYHICDTLHISADWLLGLDNRLLGPTSNYGPKIPTSPQELAESKQLLK